VELILQRNLNERSLTNLITKRNSLSATEIKSIRSLMPFALIGLVNSVQQDLWLCHVEYAAGYDQEQWLIEDAYIWYSLGQSFQQKM
jgi:hypothetical protein